MECENQLRDIWNLQLGKISQVILNSSSAVYKTELYKCMKFVVGYVLLTASNKVWEDLLY